MKQVMISMLGDGAGNVSSTRVIMLFVVVAIVASKFFNSYLTKQPIVWSDTDWGMIATVVGGKLIQNTQEK